VFYRSTDARVGITCGVDDAEQTQPDHRVAVIGGGTIGLSAVAVARSFGCKVGPPPATMSNAPPANGQERVTIPPNHRAAVDNFRILTPSISMPALLNASPRMRSRTKNESPVVL
jgi:hypothetical protein